MAKDVRLATFILAYDLIGLGATDIAKRLRLHPNYVLLVCSSPLYQNRREVLKEQLANINFKEAIEARDVMVYAMGTKLVMQIDLKDLETHKFVPTDFSTSPKNLEELIRDLQTEQLPDDENEALVG
jgi:hypothetical protein